MIILLNLRVQSHLLIYFVILDGFVIMLCREPITGRHQGQLLLDYLTDTVLSAKTELTGKPRISPDSRHVVTVDHTADGVTLVIQKITRKCDI